MKTADFLKEKMAAMKARDELKKKVLTNLLSSLNYEEKDMGRELNESEVQKIVARERKKIQEAREMAEGRPEAQESMDQEIAVLDSYLPEELSDEDLQVAVDKALSDASIERAKTQKGPAMKVAMATLTNQADGKRISQAVDVYLAGE